MNEKSEKEDDKQDKKPVDENTGFYFSSSIKIYDPNTDEVLVQKRGEN